MTHKIRVSRPATEKRELVCERTEVEDFLSATPPKEIGDGHLLPHQEREQRKIRERASFGTLRQPYANVTPADGRILPKKPDKRTRIEPEKAEIPERTGGTLML